MATPDELLRDGTAQRRELLDLALSPQRESALLIDPGLAVRGQQGVEVSAREIEEVKRSVLQAQRLQRVGATGKRATTRLLSGLAAAMTLCLVVLLPGGTGPLPQPVPADRFPMPRVMTHSSVEALGLPSARVYELAEEDFSLVLVVDESFEL